MASLKVAVITGASSGIGRQAAIKLSSEGWTLALTARRLSELEETKSLCSNSDACIIVPGDITDEAFVKGLFGETTNKFGRLDLLFNNAGMSDKANPIEDMPLEIFTSVINVNLIATFLCTREAFKIFKQQTPTGGRIINNGSLAAHVPRPHSVAYAASKHAVHGLTKTIAIEGRKYDIAVTQIDIGNAHTTMAAGHTLGALQPDGRRVVEPTFDPVHVADAIAHVANLPTSVTVLNMNIMATGAPFVGRG
ncbi:NAD(P)-binding protein [Rhizopogon vinicolor AM-OR11-026]|uniref:NAD(P)-binding protein n=1 Tax=Rhizopogon vinicolor AM-OR11-026 TaxID=1314800 RepID=A0A1B7N5V3_9AGAM|nr:NAD(P)-binding protein [Rhizopogon vinicolor AM-OR11-026]